MGLDSSHYNEEMAQALPAEDAPVPGIPGLVFTSW